MTLREFFNQDKPATAIVAGLGAELGFAVALTAGLLIAGEQVGDHLRWYGGMFIPLILLLRHYAKGRTHLRVVKTLIVVLFVTFLIFIACMLKARIIVFQ